MTILQTIPPEYIDELTGEIIYPESDGKPMAESTAHFKWITTLQGGLDALFANQTDVFVAGDLLWYPVEGQPTLCVAPDILVAFGRPKGERGCYKQWEEDNIPPQVVVEVLSKGNHTSEMLDKLAFYQTYGVQEYYLYDYLKGRFHAWHRHQGFLQPATAPPCQSPLLGVTFDIQDMQLKVFNPNGTPFLTYLEQNQQREEAMQQKNEALQQKDEALQQKDEALQQKNEALQQKNEALQQKNEALTREQLALAREQAVLAEIAQLKALLRDKGLID
jgi:Uma2 family endonuclease